MHAQDREIQKDQITNIVLPTPVIMNYTALGKIALESADAYLVGKKPIHSAGMFHGSRGIHRARQFKVVLELCGISRVDACNIRITEPLNNHGLLALLLAVFRDSRAILFSEHSSCLAGLIAEKLIQSNMFGHSPNAFDSIVFSQEALDWAIKGEENYEEALLYGGFFSQTKAVRNLLQQALIELSPQDQEDVKRSSENLRNFLTSAAFPDNNPRKSLVHHPDWAAAKAQQAASQSTNANAGANPQANARFPFSMFARRVLQRASAEPRSEHRPARNSML